MIKIKKPVLWTGSKESIIAYYLNCFPSLHWLGFVCSSSADSGGSLGFSSAAGFSSSTRSTAALATGSGSMCATVLCVCFFGSHYLGRANIDKSAGGRIEIQSYIAHCSVMLGLFSDIWNFSGYRVGSGFDRSIQEAIFAAAVWYSGAIGVWAAATFISQAAFDLVEHALEQSACCACTPKARLNNTTRENSIFFIIGYLR